MYTNVALRARGNVWCSAACMENLRGYVIYVAPRGEIDFFRSPDGKVRTKLRKRLALAFRNSEAVPRAHRRAARAWGEQRKARRDDPPRRRPDGLQAGHVCTSSRRGRITLCWGEVMGSCLEIYQLLSTRATTDVRGHVRV